MSTDSTQTSSTQPAAQADGNGGNGNGGNAAQPGFAQPIATPDPNHFTVRHGSDTQAYSILDAVKNPPPIPFPASQGGPEPVLTLAAALGSAQGAAIAAQIQQAGQIVFHSVGDTGNVKGPNAQNEVADKMVSDFDEADPRSVPSFFFNLGDVVYSFGEARYYYDQFYDAYRNYPAPIFAIAGNHDGLPAPNSGTPTLQAFWDNFCAFGSLPRRTPEAGDLARTAQIQPGVYFTLDAPFVRILGLYSNALEDPGVIAGDGLGDAQIDFLRAAFDRINNDHYSGAVIIAVHHPPYVAATPSRSSYGKHGGSPDMNAQIDAVCAEKNVWPHAVLSGHAHNYQRFTRFMGGRETPYMVSGNGGHAHNALTRKGEATLRAPSVQPIPDGDGSGQIVFENYDDQNFGYLRIIADAAHLRMEYHPASDGEAAKTPDDFVTVDLAARKLVHYQPLSSQDGDEPDEASPAAPVSPQSGANIGGNGGA